MQRKKNQRGHTDERIKKMDNITIQSLLLNCWVTKKKFGKIYTCNTLPFSHLSNIVDKYFVVNYDPDTSEGNHWVVLHIDMKHGNEYFDSYGQSPLLKVFKKCLGEKYTCSIKRIQHPMSTECG